MPCVAYWETEQDEFDMTMRCVVYSLFHPIMRALHETVSCINVQLKWVPADTVVAAAEEEAVDVPETLRSGVRQQC